MKDKKKVSIIVGVFLLVLITIGVTYAFFSYIGIGSTENSISTNSITFLYEEIDQQGSGIGITDAIPVEDSTGKSGQAFNFRIISNTNSNISIPYEITVRQKPGTDDIGGIVKLYLTKVDNNNNEEEVELSKYSDLTTVTKNNHQEKLLHTDKVPASDSEYNQRYRLRMWIDNETSFNEVTTPAHCSKGENITTQEACEALEPAGTWIPETTSYPYNNKTFAVTVNVYSTGHVQTQQDIEAASRTDITSLSVNNTVLTGNNNLYETELAPGTTETTINVETANPYTKVVIEKTDSTYTNVVSMNNIQKLSTAKKVSLSEGDNYYRIRLTSEDTTSNSELHLLITVEPPIGGSYMSNLPSQNGTTLQGLAKMVYDDNTIVDTELTESQLKAIDTDNHTGYLYKTSLTNSHNPTYYFRGKVDNNYVKFGSIDNTDLVWRIIRINEDGTLRLILDDRIGNTTYYYHTTYASNNRNFLYYTYGDYSNSANRAENILNNWYNTNINSSKVATGYYFCEQAKVASSSSFASRSLADMTVYNAEGFIPNYYCSEDNNGYGLVNAKIGLINYEEVVYAGGYFSNNSSYYLYKNYVWFTMSTAGKYDSNTSSNWCVNDNGRIEWFGNSSKRGLRPVINLKADVTGTSEVIDGKTYYTVN